MQKEYNIPFTIDFDKVLDDFFLHFIRRSRKCPKHIKIWEEFYIDSREENSLDEIFLFNLLIQFEDYNNQTTFIAIPGAPYCISENSIAYFGGREKETVKSQKEAFLTCPSSQVRNFVKRMLPKDPTFKKSYKEYAVSVKDLEKRLKGEEESLSIFTEHGKRESKATIKFNQKNTQFSLFYHDEFPINFDYPLETLLKFIREMKKLAADSPGLKIIYLDGQIKQHENNLEVEAAIDSKLESFPISGRVNQQLLEILYREWDNLLRLNALANSNTSYPRIIFESGKIISYFISRYNLKVLAVKKFDLSVENYYQAIKDIESFLKF